MAIKELKKILLQVHEPNEFRLVAQNLSHSKYYIFKIENVKRKDLNTKIRPYRKEHARFDIFINGQYILEKDYVCLQEGNNLVVKFIKANFPYTLRESDDIKLEGDIELVWVDKNQI